MKNCKTFRMTQTASRLQEIIRPPPIPQPPPPPTTDTTLLRL